MQAGLTGSYGKAQRVPFDGWNGEVRAVASIRTAKEGMVERVFPEETSTTATSPQAGRKWSCHAYGDDGRVA
jgi:hypothetical protein